MYTTDKNIFKLLKAFVRAYLKNFKAFYRHILGTTGA